MADSSYGLWEGSTNLANNGGFELTDLTNWSDYQSVLARAAIAPKFGTICGRAEGAVGIVNGDIGFARYDAIAPNPAVGAIYTLSAWVRGEGATIGKTCLLQLHDVGGGVADGYANTTTTLTADWQRVTVTLTIVQAGRTNLTAIVLVLGANAGEAIYADGFQVEQKRFATPFINTGTTTASRAEARVQGPGSVLSKTQSWVATRVRMGHANTQPGQTGRIRLFTWGPNTNEEIWLDYEYGSASFRVGRETANAGAVASVARTFARDELLTVIATWTSTTLKLSINGAAMGAGAANSNAPTLEAATQFDVGQRGYSAQDWLNGDVLWFATGSGTLADADAAAIHAFGNSDPTIASFPGTPTSLWQANDATYTTPSTSTKLAALQDNFNDNTINTTLWAVADDVAGMTVETGNRLQQTVVINQANRFAWLNSVSYYDAISSAVSVAVPTMVASVTGNRQGLMLEKDASNQVYMYFSGGSNVIRVYKNVAGVATEVLNFTYDAAVHKYLRLREAAGTTYWEWSTDGSSWTIAHSESNPIAMTLVRVRLYVANTATPSASYMGAWDSVNLTPVGSSRLLPASVRAFLGASRGLPYTKVSNTGVVGESRALPAVIGGVVGRSVALAYAKRAFIGESRVLRFNLSGRTGRSTALTYALGGIVRAVSLTRIFGRQTKGASAYVLAANTKRVARFGIGVAGRTPKLSIHLDGLGGGFGTAYARALISSISDSLLAVSDEVAVVSGQAASWVDFRFSALPGGLPFAVDYFDLGIHAGGATNVIRVFGGSSTLGGRSVADTYADGTSSSFVGATVLSTDLSVFATYFTEWVAPVQDEEQYARLPFSEAQVVLSAAPRTAAVVASCGWHGTITDPERGSFAIVNSTGPLAKYIGERVRLLHPSNETEVFAYVHSNGTIIDDISLSRRLFIQLASPATDNIRVTVETV